MAEFDITPYVIGILGLLSMFITTWLVPMIRAKTNETQQEIIQAGANIVVYAAEQLFGTKKGEEKLAYATERLQERLKKYGIRIDNGALRPYIEAAVKALKFEQEAQEGNA
jgi:lipopolysaccharide export LptBFGC system permease protein LptF